MASVCTYSTFTDSQPWTSRCAHAVLYFFEILAIVFIALYSLYTYVFTRTLYLYFPSLSLCFISLLLAPPLSFSHNCLWSVSSEYQCAAVSLETVRTERQAGYSVQGVFYDVGTLTKRTPHYYVYLCTSMAHAQYRVSKVLSFYFWDSSNDCVSTVCVFPMHMLGRLCRVDANGSSSSLPNSSLLFLALLAGSEKLRRAS